MAACVEEDIAHLGDRHLQPRVVVWMAEVQADAGSEALAVVVGTVVAYRDHLLRAACLVDICRRHLPLHSHRLECVPLVLD